MNHHDLTITDDLRSWAAHKWGVPYLPDAALYDFRQYHDDRLEEDRPAKYKRWDLAFKRFIRENSPAGSMHGYGRTWDKWLTKAKTVNLAKRMSAAPEYCPTGKREQPRPISSADVARAAIQAMRARVKA